MPEVDLLADGTQQLRRCVRDLVALSTLPAIWLKHEARQIAESVAEALVGMLGAEFVYVSVPGGANQPGIEVTRTGDRRAPDRTAAVRAALADWLGSRPPGHPVPIANPVGPGTVRVAFSPVGFAVEAVVVAASRVPDFPNEAQRLLLGVAANQMAIALQRRRAECALAEEKRSLETLNRVGALLAAELDLDRLVQAVTDAGTELTGARFGAFFYNVVNEQGESYTLYTLSGAPREAFATFPMPRNSAVFGPTFRGEGIVRSDDITKDPRYGRNAPYYGMPPGHLPVRSYLAVPVVSRSGEVLGGLFFGHEQVGIFAERAEKLIAGIAAHAAIAIDNARLYQAAQREIERRQRVEAALREGRERLRAALEASGTGTFRWDIRTNSLEWDEALDQLFGLQPGETVRRLDQFLSLVHPDDRAGVAARCARCASNGADFDMEFRVVWPDGSVRWLYDRGKTFRDPEGRPAYMAGACVDVSERKRAEGALRQLTESLERRVGERTRELADANAQLRRERALSELLVESTIGGIAAVDRELRYTLFNPAMERMTGVPRTEVLGKVIFEAFPYLKGSAVEAAWRRAVERQEPSSVHDMRYVVARSGREGYYEASYSPLYGSDGGCIGALALVRDTTEQRRMEEALHQAQRLEAIAQLTGGVAHDFNNLLMVIGGNLELLKQQRANPERVIGAIERAIARGQSLTRQLLSFSRQQALQPKVLDLHAHTPKLIDLLRPSLRGDIEIVTDVAQDAWPVKVDPGEFELALLNIAVNARDAMPRGGRLSISIRNERLHAGPGGLSGDFVRIAVIDTGTGIPTDVVDKVFEPFFTTKEVGKGTGLGLSQVYGFATQSGGAATIDSEVGKGTTVTVLLPRSTTPLLPACLEAAAQAPRRTTGTILLVEDNEEVAEVSTALLKDLGCRVEHARTARQALEMLSDGEKFDLILTDIIMPGGTNGLDLARAVRQRFPRLPVLLTTGYSAAAQEAAAEGFTILPKPYQRQALESAVRAIFERQRDAPNVVE